MVRSKKNTKPSKMVELHKEGHLDLFATLLDSTIASTSTSTSVPSAFEDSAFYENVVLPSYEAEELPEHLRRGATSYGVAPTFVALPSYAGLEVGLPFETGSPFALPETPYRYRGGRQKDAMVSPDERRKRDNHNQVERRRRQDIADKLSELQKLLKRPGSTKKEIIMAALVQRQNDLDEIKRLETTLADLEAMDS